ncbi:putative cytochrome p450 monooxygenase protein [Botrytis fragariae]|uniref:Putative cytochrome p450 monooxygenase protein n=1 Tax=Botrytis fragariae TaxID=1964551 RepID=A0A8H6AV91_9HELO|nr:putative cytochrome p450 monooxygenase protein [Botrytis fragariae]KAF5874221.1 putative cytochrome p450 monooxygenase protein [Botrytis fragariae]
MDFFIWFQSLPTAQIAFVLIFFASFVKVIHQAYLTPLRKIPGPWYARFTHLVLKYHVITGRRIHYIHSLHQTYGHIVLVAPNEVSCSSLSSFKTIHRISKTFLKSTWYHSFVTGPENVFSMVDPKLHGVRRKMFAHAFSKSSLKATWESEVRKKTNIVVNKIKRDALLGEVDILKFFMFMATDVIGHLCFGESFGTLEKEQKTQYIEDLQRVSTISGIRAEFPRLFKIGKMSGLSFLKTPDDRLSEYASLAVRNAKSQSDATPNIFRKILAEGKSESAEGSLSDLDIRQEATAFIVAGTDTTANSLTFLVYNILKHPNLRTQIEDEVDTLGDEFESKDVEGLQLLNAVIDEGLRLWGAAPGSLPRMVPHEGVELDGYFLPGSMTVSTQSYTIHRDPEIFPEPERFDPQRWLGPKSDDFKSANHAFGAGTRTCIGIHLARMEMQLVLASFFRECKGMRIASSQDDEGMEIENFFLIGPKGHKCALTMREGF